MLPNPNPNVIQTWSKRKQALDSPALDHLGLPFLLSLFDIFLTFIYLPQNTNNNEIKQNSNTKANKSGEEAQKKPWGLEILGSLLTSHKNANEEIITLVFQENPTVVRLFIRQSKGYCKALFYFILFLLKKVLLG